MNLHFYWDQGWDKAPSLARTYVEIWRQLNPEFEIELHDSKSMQMALEDAKIPEKGLSLQIKSDILRLYLLKEYGGIWVDASVMPVEPLADWFSQRFDKTGFFVLQNPSNSRILASWFIYAEKRHPLIAGWYDHMVKYFKTPRSPLSFAPKALRKITNRTISFNTSLSVTKPVSFLKYYPYFIMHYHFEYLVGHVPDFKKIYKEMPMLQSRPAFELFHYCNSSSGEMDRGDLDFYLRRSPIHKLTWKPNANVETAVNYFANQSN